MGITAIGKYKLQVDLERPVPYINELLALNTFNPQNEKVAKKLLAYRININVKIPTIKIPNFIRIATYS